MRRFMPIALAAGLVAGCGARGFGDAAPSYETVALDMEETSAESGQALDGRLCHPHLFQRTRDIVRVINHHLFKVFGRADAIIATAPTSSADSSRTWVRVHGQLTVKATLAHAEDGTYTYLVQMKARDAAEDAFVVVAQGSILPGDEPHTGTGSLRLDLTALAALVPGERAGGLVLVDFDVTGDLKTVRVQLQGFTPDADSDVIPPRDSNYVFQRARGVGGSLKFSADMVLFCPQNAARTTAQVKTVTRWAKVGGTWAGRADSMATGGQIAAGDRWVGTVCFQPEVAGAEAEHYWQMKLVSATGASASAYVDAHASGEPTSPCDPVFGPAPSLESDAGDFDFASVDFEDETVVSYPGRATPGA